jgi:hypothetical protein
MARTKRVKTSWNLRSPDNSQLGMDTREYDEGLDDGGEVRVGCPADQQARDEQRTLLFGRARDGTSTRNLPPFPNHHHHRLSLSFNRPRRRGIPVANCRLRGS